MDIQVDMVPSSQTAFVAQPILDENGKVKELKLSRIVAWRVQTETAQPHGHIEAKSNAFPVTCDIGEVNDDCIYFSDTETWEMTDGKRGKGLESLLAHLKVVLPKKSDLAS